MITLIAAIGKNNEVGKNNALLWDLPDEMKHFREKTLDKTIIMGRKTFESIGRPLPRRNNIVITRDAHFAHEGVTVAHSLDEALEIAKQSEIEIFIIGGGELYKQALPFADTLEITHVDMTAEADTHFPEIDPKKWQAVSSLAHDKDERHSHSFEFVRYEKVI